MFRIVETLFELRITPDQAPVWHDSVRLFRIERDGALVGQFYLDAFARAGKRPGAWMDDARGRWRRPDGAHALQTPVAYLVCNFAPPLPGRDALLTHDDLITLFHEFGHGLHHMLTRIDELAWPASPASSGMRSSCRASSWRTSAGSGRCCRA